MLDHCGGLPLAVVVLGGLLVRKHTLGEWKKVYRNIRDKGIGEQHGVARVLALSYHDLPYQLKPCFVYFGFFPEDSKINTEKVCQMWIAEGLVLSKDRAREETMMDVAKHYLSELAQRSMLQLQEEEEEERNMCGGYYRYCRLHDLMRDLCLLKAKEENFLKVIDYEGKNNSNDELEESSSSSIYATRRLAIQLGEVSGICIPPKKETTQHHLRSLVVFGVNRYMEATITPFTNFKLLRVLSIEGIWIRNSTAEEIANLIHLRYLSLRDSCVSRIPSSLGNLEQLQTLDLRVTIMIDVPKNLLQKMRQLRHLYLPQHFNKKMRLDGVNLETLVNFDNDACKVEDIFKSTNLRKLQLWVSEKREDVEWIINYLTTSNTTPNNLDLRIYYNFVYEEAPSLLKMLFGFHGLDSLTLRGSIGKLPDFNDFSSNVSVLALVNCDLKEDPMPTLEKLPKLRNLSFCAYAFEGEEMVCSATGFSQLRKLGLLGLRNLEKWRVDEGAMPNLIELEIMDCKKLKEVPDGL